MSKKLVSLILAMALLLGMCSAALADYYSNLIPVTKTESSNFTGKTVILHSNDVHGAISGYACMPALRDSILALGASDVLLVDAGDFTQGDIYVSVNKGKAAIDMMNAAGYDVVTLGNHEFDFGYDQLMENLKDARFKTICCNVYLDKTGETILPPSTVIETSTGLKLGFVGVETPQTATKVNPGLITEISFATFAKMYDAVQDAVDAIRGECDLVIGLTHLGVNAEAAINGYRSVDLLNSVEGIDFAIDAHSHTVMSSAKYGLPVQSTGTKFAYVGVIVIDNATKVIEDHFLLSTATLPKDETVAAAAQEIIDAVDAEYNTPFATTETFLDGARENNRTRETNLGDLVADAMLWKVLKEGGLENIEPDHVVTITNGGGIRANIDVGDVSMESINSVLPFGNTVTVIYATGAEILEALEASTFSTPEQIGGFPQTSGIEWTVDCTKPFDKGDLYLQNGKDTSYYAPASIQRVTITAIHGKPFDPSATYAVVTNNFIAAGGDTYNVFNRAYEAGTGFDSGIPMDQAVCEFVAEALNGKITAEQYGQPRGSLTIILPEEDAAQPAA
jgi:2',3'-cyclic-nucleotide 2'-phosphodiesterase (5'-nucleotidase family)